MKILIVGSDLNSHLLAKYIKMQDSQYDIYITTTDNSDPQTYTALNIRENDIASIIDFVKYNGIEFTIALSNYAIINGIADAFKKEEFVIFAPYSEAARITFFNSIAKKVMYKLKIATPRFGIFDRENLATDYVRRLNFPIVIENDFTLMERENNICTCFSKAKEKIQKIFEENNQKIVIENYINETPIYVYFITDGYNALPLIDLERISGENYTSINAPTKKISEEIYIKLLQTVIYPIIDDISKYTDNYVGILGLKIKLIKNDFYVHEIYNNFQYYDLQAFLSLLNENLLNVLYDCANGCLADNYNYIKLDDKYSYTIAIDKNKINKQENCEEEFFESEDNHKFIITTKSATMNKAHDDLCEYIETIADEDIIKNITISFKQRELAL